MALRERETGDMELVGYCKPVAYPKEGGPLPISQLETAGINAATVKKLQEAGFYTVESVGAVLSVLREGCIFDAEEIIGSERNQRDECTESAASSRQAYPDGISNRSSKRNNDESRLPSTTGRDRILCTFRQDVKNWMAFLQVKSAFLYNAKVGWKQDRLLNCTVNSEPERHNCVILCA